MKTGGSAVDARPIYDIKRHKVALARFCTGVTVVTSCHADEPVGFTCQSFTSLSLEPPLVLICASRSSVSWPTIRQSGHYCVNILSADQEVVSRRFAVSGSIDKFTNGEWHLSNSGCPVLANILAYIECTILCTFDGGDHEIAVGRVLNVDVVRSDIGPLLFNRGTYMGLPSSNPD
jgi:flavin reductase (DIM6/NTAB) family NADH-FMN oxidoreductase RutF